MSNEHRTLRGEGDAITRCLELFHEGGIAEADQLASQAPEVSPDDGALWQLHGLLRQRAGDYEGACAALETAALLVPLSPASQCALADCHASAGRYELASDLYHGLARNRACPTVLLPALASGLGRIGDAATALNVCRELTRRAPANHEAFFGIAYYMRLLGHPTATLPPVVTRAFALYPQSPVYRVLLASLLAQLGRIEEACAILRDLEPNTVRCAGCLRRVMAILDRGGEIAVLNTFRDHVARAVEQAPGQSP